MQRSVCLVGKGPSASVLADPPAWLAGWRFATLNESALILPAGTPVDHLFAVDVESIEAAKPFWDRVRTFHIGTELHRRQRHDPTAMIDEIEGLPLHRVLHWDYRDYGVRPRGFAQRARESRLAFYVNSTVALHLLAKLGYERIWCVGHDGGRAVAGGLTTVLRASEDYNARAHAMRALATELRRVHGIDIRFAPDTFEDVPA